MNIKNLSLLFSICLIYVFCGFGNAEEPARPYGESDDFGNIIADVPMYVATNVDRIVYSPERFIETIQNTDIQDSGYVIDIATNLNQFYDVDYDAALSGNQILGLPKCDISKYGKLNIFIRQAPSSGFYYDFNNENISNLPLDDAKDWLSFKVDSIWKFEFESIPGMEDWSLLQYSKRTSIPDFVSLFEFSDGSQIVTNVTEIEDNAFYERNDLIKVKLGKNITRIGNLAFCVCENLTDIDIPNGVTNIGNAAFSSCDLTSVIIPENVNNLDDMAFAYNYNLTNVVILGNITNDWGGDDYSPFVECPLSSVTFGTNMTRIGNNMFESSTSEFINLTNITIPNNITEVGHWAFYSCVNLEYLFVPENWEGTSILDDAKIPEDCKVIYGPIALSEYSKEFSSLAQNDQEVDVFANIPWTVETSESWIHLQTTNGDGIGKVIYNIDENDGNIRTGIISIIGNNVTKTFTITQNTQSLLTRLYYNDGSIIEKNIVGTLNDTYLGNKNNLVNIQIGSTVTNIAQNTFNNCSILTNVTIPNSVLSIAGGPTSGGSSTIFVDTPNIIFDTTNKPGLNMLNKWVFKSNYTNTDIDLSNVNGIVDHALVYTSSITNLYIPKDITFVGWDGFGEANNIETIEFERPREKPIIVEAGAFGSMRKIKKLYVPGQMESLPMLTFGGASNLEILFLEAGIKSMTSWTFIDAFKLTTVVIPYTLNEIGIGVFKNDSLLKTFYFTHGPNETSEAREATLRSMLNGMGDKGSFNLNGAIFIDITDSVPQEIIDAFSDLSLTPPRKTGKLLFNAQPTLSETPSAEEHSTEPTAEEWAYYEEYLQKQLKYLEEQANNQLNDEN